MYLVLNSAAKTSIGRAEHSPTVKPASAESTEHVVYLEFMIREVSVVFLGTMC